MLTEEEEGRRRLPAPASADIFPSSVIRYRDHYTARVLNSQKDRIDEMELREIGIDAMLAFQRTFPWSHLSPTLHKALAHGWELVQMNKCKGLGKFAENGIEGQNKWIEWYKEHGSRQCP